MFPSARLGDIHICPLPGHGSTPIASASATTSINFMGAARVGDVAGCGAVITTGFLSILVDGLPMAYLGSRSTHGGMIITGSPDTFGGFKIGGGAIPMVIIDFAKLGVMLPDNTICMKRLATLLADPRLIEKATVACAIVDPNAIAKAPHPEIVCAHPDQMEEVATYIAEEMNRNIHDPAVLEMKRLNTVDIQAERDKFYAMPWYARLVPPNFEGQALGSTAAAFTLWAEKVGQNRPWDHKPLIKAKTGAYWHKQGAYVYYYDIWSNIHYGYVGRSAGFSEAVLLDGAGLEQIFSDSIRYLQDSDKNEGPHRREGSEGLRAFDDSPDRISITIGIQLYAAEPKGPITAALLMDKVLAVGTAQWEKGAKPHECE